MDKEKSKTEYEELYKEMEKKIKDDLEQRAKESSKWPKRVFNTMIGIFIVVSFFYMNSFSTLWFSIQTIVAMAAFLGTQYLFMKSPALASDFVDNVWDFEFWAICIGIVYVLSGSDLISNLLSSMPVKFMVTLYAGFYCSLKFQEKETKDDQNDKRQLGLFSTMFEIKTNQFIEESKINKLKKDVAELIITTKATKTSNHSEDTGVYPNVATRIPRKYL